MYKSDDQNILLFPKYKGTIFPSFSGKVKPAKASDMRITSLTDGKNLLVAGVQKF